MIALNRLSRALVHVRRGTLAERLRCEWLEYRNKGRQLWWQSQSARHQYIEADIQAGVRIRLYFDSCLSYPIYYEDFEWNELQFIDAFLRPGDVFVDIGANIGLFTLVAAHRVRSSGLVHAFEPCSRTFERLLENVSLNKLRNVQCHQLALSDTGGEVSMNVSLDGYDAWNSIARPIQGDSFGVETVSCTTWDDFAQNQNLAGRVTMMKMDVEGWEARVLSGAHQVLSRADAPILQVEFTELASQSAGSSCAKTYHVLEELGYQLFRYDAKSEKLISEPVREHYTYSNLFAIKDLERVIARLERRY